MDWEVSSAFYVAGKFLPGGAKTGARLATAVDEQLATSAMGKLSAARPVLVQMAAEAPGTAASSALETLIDATDSYDTSIKDHKATPKQAWNAFAQTVQREGIGTFLTNLAGVYSPEIKGVKGKIIHAGLDPAMEGFQESVVQGMQQRQAINENVPGANIPLMQGVPEELMGSMIPALIFGAAQRTASRFKGAQPGPPGAPPGQRLLEAPPRPMGPAGDSDTFVSEGVTYTRQPDGSWSAVRGPAGLLEAPGPARPQPGVPPRALLEKPPIQAGPVGGFAEPSTTFVRDGVTYSLQPDGSYRGVPPPAPWVPPRGLLEKPPIRLGPVTGPIGREQVTTAPTPAADTAQEKEEQTPAVQTLEEQLAASVADPTARPTLPPPKPVPDYSAQHEEKRVLRLDKLEALAAEHGITREGLAELTAEDRAAFLKQFDQNWPSFEARAKAKGIKLASDAEGRQTTRRLFLERLQTPRETTESAAPPSPGVPSVSPISTGDTGDTAEQALPTAEKPEVHANKEDGVEAHIVPSTGKHVAPGYIVSLWDTDAGKAVSQYRILPTIEAAREYARKIIGKPAAEPAKPAQPTPETPKPFGALKTIPKDARWTQKAGERNNVASGDRVTWIHHDGKSHNGTFEGISTANGLAAVVSDDHGPIFISSNKLRPSQMPATPATPSKAAAPEAQAVSGFETTKGSKYTTVGSGTQRFKTETGEQFKPSDSTVYITPAVNQRVLESLQSGNIGSTRASVRIVGDKLAVVVKDRDSGKIRNDLSKTVPYSDTPEVGLHPVEVWNKNPETGEYGFHLGHPIARITSQPTATAETAAAPPPPPAAEAEPEPEAPKPEVVPFANEDLGLEAHVLQYPDRPGFHVRTWATDQGKYVTGSSREFPTLEAARVEANRRAGKPAPAAAPTPATPAPEEAEPATPLSDVRIPSIRDKQVWTGNVVHEGGGMVSDGRMLINESAITKDEHRAKLRVAGKSGSPITPEILQKVWNHYVVEQANHPLKEIGVVADPDSDVGPKAIYALPETRAWQSLQSRHDSFNRSLEPRKRAVLKTKRATALSFSTKTVNQSPSFAR